MHSGNADTHVRRVTDAKSGMNGLMDWVEVNRISVLYLDNQ